MSRSKLCILVVIVVVCGPGCGDGTGPTGEVVGGPCTVYQDCATGSICLTSGDFPGGTCAVDCSPQNPFCPDGAVCIEKEGGVCLIACQVAQDCRPGYTCKGRERITKDGEALVCIKD